MAEKQAKKLKEGRRRLTPAMKRDRVVKLIVGATAEPQQFLDLVKKHVSVLVWTGVEGGVCLTGGMLPIPQEDERVKGVKQ